MTLVCQGLKGAMLDHIQTPHPIPSHLILAHPILSYLILSYSILSYLILSYTILSCTVLCCPTLSYREVEMDYDEEGEAREVVWGWQKLVSTGEWLQNGYRMGTESCAPVMYTHARTSLHVLRFVVDVHMSAGASTSSMVERARPE